jgi:hypothetical protein
VEWKENETKMKKKERSKEEKKVKYKPNIQQNRRKQRT